MEVKTKISNEIPMSIGFFFDKIIFAFGLCSYKNHIKAGHPKKNYIFHYCKKHNSFELILFGFNFGFYKPTNNNVSLQLYNHLNQNTLIETCFKTYTLNEIKVSKYLFLKLKLRIFASDNYNKTI
jgi:hypothetical protein